MTVIVCCTNAVDESAMLLAQSFDNVLFTKGLDDLNDEMYDALGTDDNSLVFYGVVGVPDWFTEQKLNGKFDDNRVFNYPDNTRKLLERNNVLANLRAMGYNTPVYYRIREDTTYTSLRERIGSRTFDLVMKSGMKITNTVNNATEFNRFRNSVDYACKHINPAKKIRVFLGIPDVCGGVLGSELSENRVLTFREQIEYGANTDVRNHIEALFQRGLLVPAMGENVRQEEAWTEKVYKTASDMDQTYMDTFKNLASVLHETYHVDFCCVDAIEDKEGNLWVMNTTASPSLQNDTVLGFVSDYFKELTTYGRKLTREKLIEIINNLPDDQIENTGKLLKQAMA